MKETTSLLEVMPFLNPLRQLKEQLNVLTWQFNHIERESYKLLKFIINPIYIRAVPPATGSNLSPFPSHFSFLHSQPSKGREDGQAFLITLFLLGKFAMSLPGGSANKESACQWRRCGRSCGFDPWVWKIPWRGKWQPTPVFLPGKSQGQRSQES